MNNYKVLLCGAKWGKTYIIPIVQDELDKLEGKKYAISDYDMLIEEYFNCYNKVNDLNYQSLSLTPKLDISGILSRGSEESIMLASLLEIPLYKNCEEIKADSIDIACLAISEKNGGEQIFFELLQKGINVLIEHPVSTELLRKAFIVSKSNNAVFNVNSHFGDCEAISVFIRKALELNTYGLPCFIQMTSSLRSLYSLFDIVGRIVGSLDSFEAKKISESKEYCSFKIMEGYINNIQFVLNCQSNINSMDNSENVLATHNIHLYYSQGTLSLIGGINGVVTWCSNQPINEYSSDTEKVIYPNTNSTKNKFATRLVSNRINLERLIEQIETGRTKSEQSEKHLLQVSSAYEKVISELGNFKITDLSEKCNMNLYYNPEKGRYSKHW